MAWDYLLAATKSISFVLIKRQTIKKQTKNAN